MLDTVRERQRIRPPTDASVLEDVVLSDQDGRQVRLGDLWSDRPAVLVFVRHFGCVFCLAGAKVATLPELIGPRQILRGLRATIMSRLRQGSIAVHQGRIVGHAAQLGGVLVIAPDGSVRYAHLSQESGDDPPAREVLAAARAIRPHLNSASTP